MIYLTFAYGAVWLLVTLYVTYMGTRQRKLAQEIEILEEIVSQAK